MKTSTGYESYTVPELIALRSGIDASIESLRVTSDGEGLTAEVARANRRELYRQQTAINATITRKAK